MSEDLSPQDSPPSSILPLRPAHQRHLWLPWKQNAETIGSAAVSRGTRTHWNSRSVWESGDLHEHSWRCGRRCGRSRYYSCYSWSSAGLKVTLSSSQLSWKEKKKRKKRGDGELSFIFAIINRYRISGGGGEHRNFSCSRFVFYFCLNRLAEFWSDFQCLRTRQWSL